MGIELTGRRIDGGVLPAGRLLQVTASGGSEPQAGPGSASAPWLADEEGLDRAFLDYRAEMAGLARRVLGSPDLAEEAVQETFVRAWRSRDRFDPTLGSLRAWLFAIERNLLVDMGRSRARRESLVQQTAEERDPTTDGVERALISWQVEEAIALLTPEHRGVLVEIYFGGRTSKEIAQHLHLPEGTVRSRLYYALRTLKSILEEMGWEG